MCLLYSLAPDAFGSVVVVVVVVLGRGAADARER